MNMESNSISPSWRKGPHNMAVALHACLLQVAFYVKARLCRSQLMTSNKVVARYYAPEGGHLRLPRNLGSKKDFFSDSNHQSSDYKSSAPTTRLPTAAAELTENLWYLCTVLINVYVASPDPDPNPRGGGELPNPESAILR